MVESSPMQNIIMLTPPGLLGGGGEIPLLTSILRGNRFSRDVRLPRLSREEGFHGRTHTGPRGPPEGGDPVAAGIKFNQIRQPGLCGRKSRLGKTSTKIGVRFS